MSNRIYIVEDPGETVAAIIATVLGLGALYAVFVALKFVFHDGPIALYYLLAGWRDQPLPYSPVSAWYYFALIRIPVFWAAPIAPLWNGAQFVSTPFPHINDILNPILALLTVLSYIGGTIYMTVCGVRLFVRRLGKETVQRALALLLFGPILLLAAWLVLLSLWGVIASCVTYLFDRHPAANAAAGFGLAAAGLPAVLQEQGQ